MSHKMAIFLILNDEQMSNWLGVVRTCQLNLKGGISMTGYGKSAFVIGKIHLRSWSTFPALSLGRELSWE